MSGRRAAGNRIRGPQSALTDFLAANNISAQQIRDSYEQRARAAQQQTDDQATAQAARAGAEAEERESTPPSAKKRKAQKKKAEAKLKAKKSKKAAGSDDDFEDSEDDLRGLARDMYKKAKPNPGQLEHCEECNKRFTVTPYSKTGPGGGLLCTPCGKVQTMADKKNARVAAKPTGGRKRRQVESNRLDGLITNGAKSLEQLCIEKVADHHLDIEEFGDLPETVLSRLSQIFSKKRILSPRTLKLFLRPDLKHITVHDAAYIETDDYKQMLAVAPHIERLTIVNACQFKDANLEYLAEKAPNISYLQIYAANLVTEDAWRAFFSEYGHKLETLKLQWLDASFDDETVQHMVMNCPNLKRLKLKYCRRVTAESLAHISSLTSLEHLSLNTTHAVPPEMLTSMVLALGPSLQTLSLEGFVETDDTVLAAISQTCTRLTKLRLKDLDAVTDAALANLFSPTSAIPPLGILDLSGARDIDENNPTGPEDAIGLSARAFTALMAHSAQSLEVLDVASCRHIPHAALCDVFHEGNMYPSLRDINLSFCGSVDTAVIRALFLCCPALKKVTAFGCFKIEDVAVPRGIALIGVPRAQDAIEQFGDVEFDLKGMLSELGMGTRAML